MGKNDGFGPTPPEAGKSSFDLLDFEVLLAALPLTGVKTIADLGCGKGNYSIPLAKRLGSAVEVCGFDLWEEGVKVLNQSAAALGIPNLKSERADLSKLTSLADESVDLALMATVLHDLAERHVAGPCLREAARVLKKGGTLAVVEFHKNDSKPGPPLSIRLSAEEVAVLAAEQGFKGGMVTDVGQNLYLVILTLA